MVQESQPSAFWLPSAWGLRAGGQLAINFLHLAGILVSAQQLRGMTQDIICSP